jgi:uncharacterized membrane protein
MRVKRLGGLVILLQNPTSETGDKHPSEALPAEPDITIVNQGAPSLLYDQIDSAIGVKMQARAI